MKAQQFPPLPLKRLAAVMPSNVDKHSVEGERAIRLCNYVDVYRNERITSDMDFMEATAADAQIARFTLQAQDVIITKDSEEPTDIGIPAHVPQDLPGIVCGYHLAVLRSVSSRLYGGFLHWALQSRNVQAYYAKAATGVSRYALSIDDIGSTPIAQPPLPDQIRIAKFLDEQTARIDALIAEKERLAELLLEEEQSCIDKAVLAGQDPVPPFPFTPPTCTFGGVVWRRVALKRHWQVTDCKHLTVEFVEDGYPLASIREVSGGFLQFGNAKRARETDFLNLIEGGRQPHRGDLIYARNASVGAAAYVDTDEPFAMGQDVCLISSADQDQRFLRLQLMSSPVKAQLEGLLVGATIRRINVEQLRDFVLLVPPVEVQRAVVVAAEAELARRANLRLHLSEHIDRLREYRSSLISAAVTGQLNLDKFQAQQLEATC